MHTCQQYLWGKTDRKSHDDPPPYHPLLFHMLDVAAVASVLLPRYTLIDPIPDAWVLYLIALHDLGKADPRFQMRVPGLAMPLRDAGFAFPVTEPDHFRHEAMSAAWVRRHLRQIHGWSAQPARVIAGCLAGHHGNFKVESDPTFTNEYDDDAGWNELRASLAEDIAAALDLQPLSLVDVPYASAVGIRLSGLLVLSDWIASSEELYGGLSFGRTVGHQATAAQYYPAACEQARAAVNRLALTVGLRPDRPGAFTDVWPKMVVPRPAQKTIELECAAGLASGLAILEDEMGSGKTEAAIYLAQHWNALRGAQGDYIALPTMATSNQIHHRFAEFLKERQPDHPSPRLVHGMAWLLDDDVPNDPPATDGEEQDRDLALDWFRNTKRALLAPEGVGTIDQALMAVLNVRFGFLRLFGLSGKTLIVDEVHACDEYMTVLLSRLLRWCGSLQIPVILLSATLSRRQKERLAAAYAGRTIALHKTGYPLLTIVPLEGNAREVPFAPYRDHALSLVQHPGLLGDAAETAKLAAGLVRDGGCCCVLVNTVREAQEVFAALDGISLTLDDLRLFHARFPAGRRDEIEKKLMDLYGKGPEDGPNPLRPYRSILVSTQTVEQSLDVDFDVMVTAVCPIDLLLQRSGRVQRHEGIHPRPLGTAATLHILLPKEGSLTFGPTGHVYDVDPLLRTLAILHARETIRLPDELRCLIEKCYGNEALPSDVIPDDALTDAAAKLKIKHEKAINEAKTHLIPDPADSHFVLARLPNQPVHEAEEGDRASYFHAQTRMTDEDSETVPVLLPDTPQLIQVACRDHAPDRETLRKLFLRKANIPAWWLKDASGEPPVFEGPRWLRGHRVIPLTKGRWQATVDGRSYTLFDDNMSGLSWVPDQESGANEKATEALQE